MIDLHCHILPGVDDGPDQFEEAIEMLKIACSEGTRSIVATPHIHHPDGYQQPVCAKHLVERLNAYARNEFLEIKVFLGAEYYISQDFKSYLVDIKNFTINNSNYVMIEFDAQVELELMLEACADITRMGLVPIIAHVERYRAIHDHPICMEQLRSVGALFQMSSNAIFDDHEQMIWGLKCIGTGLIDFIASDGHRMNCRKPLMDRAYKRLLDQFGPKTALRLMTQNPDAVLRNDEILTFEGFDLAAEQWRTKAGLSSVFQSWDPWIATSLFVIGAAGLLLGLIQL